MSYEPDLSVAIAAGSPASAEDGTAAPGMLPDTTYDDLPPADTKRWVVRRKEQVVQAVQAGRLTRASACERYHLSDEEYGSWEQQLSSHGVRGLRVTRLQDYRRHLPAVAKAAPLARNPRMLAGTEA